MVTKIDFFATQAERPVIVRLGFGSLSGKTTDDVDHELFIRYNGCERKILIEGNGSISIKACP